MMPLLVLALLRATGTAIGRGRFAAARTGPSGTSRRMPPVKPGVNGTPSWTAAAAAGLALAVVTAAALSLLVPAAVVIILAGLLLRRRGRTLWWALLPSAALFVPFGLSTLDRPRALLADPGLPLGFDAAPLWQQVLGQPLSFDVAGGLSGLAPFAGGPVPWALLLALLIGAPVLALAVAALLLPCTARPRGPRPVGGCPHRSWPAAGWPGTSPPAPAPQALVTPFPGAAVSAADFRAAGGRADRRRQPAGPRRGHGSRRCQRRGPYRGRAGAPSVRATAGAGHSTPAGRTTGRARGLDGPERCSSRPRSPCRTRRRPPGLGAPRLVAATDPRTLPATAIDRGEGPEQTRTLLISTGENGTFSASLMRGAGTTLDGLSTIASARDIRGVPGSESVREDDEVTAALRTTVATLVAGHGVDPRPELERLGVGFVVLRVHGHRRPADREPDGRRPGPRSRWPDRLRLALACQPAERPRSAARRRRPPRAHR